MLLLPAIDLMSGQVVRLRQGRAEEKTVYPGTPAEWAQRWERAGGHWLHVVDLDAAVHGRIPNLEAVRAIAEATKIPVQFGGGMRDQESILRALEIGVRRVVIGTRAVESRHFVGEMIRTFGAERIGVGIDASGSRAAVRGWTESSAVEALELAREIAGLGPAAIVYTDIATDGMMSGPNFAAIDRLLQNVDCPVIASGGVSRIDDLHELGRRAKLHGVIIGRALYEGSVDLAEFRPPAR